jgi:hypothetical protein
LPFFSCLGRLQTVDVPATATSAKLA